MSSPIHSWQWQITPRALLMVKFSMEFWYNKLANGEVVYNLIHAGWYIRVNYPDIKIYTLTLFGLSIRLGVYKK